MKLFAASLSLLTLFCHGSLSAFANCPTPPGLDACQSCHMLEPGRKSRATGPNLVGAVGQPVMHDASFDFYSLALKAAKAKGLKWTDENLMAYMADPKGFLNEFNGEELRSSMTFQLKDEAKRKAALEGLKTISNCQ